MANYRQLTELQRTAIKEVMTSMKALVQEFTQLILTFSTSLIKLKTELYNAQIAKSGSCECSGTSNGTEKTVSTSMFE